MVQPYWQLHQPATRRPGGTRSTAQLQLREMTCQWKGRTGAHHCVTKDLQSSYSVLKLAIFAITPTAAPLRNFVRKPKLDTQTTIEYILQLATKE